MVKFARSFLGAFVLVVLASVVVVAVDVIHSELRVNRPVWIGRPR